MIEFFSQVRQSQLYIYTFEFSWHLSQNACHLNASLKPHFNAVIARCLVDNIIFFLSKRTCSHTKPTDDDGFENENKERRKKLPLTFRCRCLQTE